MPREHHITPVLRAEQLMSHSYFNLLAKKTFSVLTISKIKHDQLLVYLSSTRNNTCMLLLLPACYTCLWTYIMYLGSHLSIQFTCALNARDFHLRVNQREILLERVLSLADIECTRIKFKSNCTIVINLLLCLIDDTSK